MSATPAAPDATGIDAVAQDTEISAVLDLIPAAVLVKDRDSRFLYVNQPGAVGYGKPPEALIGKRERDEMPPGIDIDAYLASDVEVIDTGVTRVIREQPFVTHDGSHLLLHITKSRITFQGTPAVLIFCYALEPIHSVKRLERKVAEKQRLESLGLLAGGIAHDFNNLLVGVLAHADLALRHIPAHSEATRYLERLRGAALRLAELSKQMLAYTGRARVESQLVDLSALTAEMIDLTASTLPRHVTLVPRLARDLPPTSADPAQLRQIVLNLITNAAEAIGEREGEVRMRTEVRDFDPNAVPGLVVGAERRPGTYVRLTVEDDGEGMNQYTFERLFDPFYTTKASGRGLGLSAVLGIVRSHAGAMHVRSAPGEGTRFRLWFPIAAGKRPTSSNPSPAPVPSSLRVLIVDDESIVLEAARAVLETHGLSVCTAVSAAEALATLETDRTIDIALLDVTMPGTTVEQSHAGLRAVRPDLPILLTSGYSAPGVLERISDEKNTRFIEKPYDGAELVWTLERLARHAARQG